MRAFLILIKREILAGRKIIVITYLMLLMFPLILFLLIALPMYKSIQTVNNLEYLSWVAPGIWIVSSAFTAFLLSMATSHHLKFESRLAEIYLKSPVSIAVIILPGLMWGLAHGIMEMGVSVLETNLIIADVTTPAKIFKMIAQILPLILFFSVLGTVLGTWVEKFYTLSTITFVLFMFFTLGTGNFIPLDLFPATYNQILSGSPIVGDINHTQNILMNRSGSVMDGVITTLIAGLIYFLHNLACYRYFRRN